MHWKPSLESRYLKYNTIDQSILIPNIFPPPTGSFCTLLQGQRAHRHDASLPPGEDPTHHRRRSHSKDPPDETGIFRNKRTRTSRGTVLPQDQENVVIMLAMVTQYTVTFFKGRYFTVGLWLGYQCSSTCVGTPAIHNQI